MPAPKYPPGGGIYAIVHVASGRMYVGQTIRFRGRFNSHRVQANAGKHCNPHLQRAWTKYGEAAFRFDVLEVVDDPEQLTAREQHWIDATGAVERGFNMCPAAGSCLGRAMSDEHKAKISAKAKARGVTPEQIATMRAARPAIVSDETRARLSAAGMGRVFSAETKAKISAAHKGRVLDRERVEKQRASLTGRKQPKDEIERRRASMMGRVVSAETRAKQSAAHKGQIVSEAQRAAISAKLKWHKQTPEQIAKRKASFAARSPEAEAARRAKLAAATAAYHQRKRAGLEG